MRLVVYLEERWRGSLAHRQHGARVTDGDHCNRRTHINTHHHSRAFHTTRLLGTEETTQLNSWEENETERRRAGAPADPHKTSWQGRVARPGAARRGPERAAKHSRQQPNGTDELTEISRRSSIRWLAFALNRIKWSKGVPKAECGQPIPSATSESHLTRKKMTQYRCHWQSRFVSIQITKVSVKKNIFWRLTFATTIF